MKIKVWVVTTCVPGETEPCLPFVFGTEAEAEAYAEEALRAEWAENGPEDDETGEIKPYPGNWRAALNGIVEWRRGLHTFGPVGDVTDEKWGEWQVTSHEIEVVGAAGPSSPEYLDRFPPEARVHVDRAYQDGYEDGGNGAEALATALDNILAHCTGEHGHGNALIKARAIAEAAVKEFRKAAEGWIEWDGNVNTRPRKKIVDVRYRDGREFHGEAGDGFLWHHDGAGDDIVSYRIVGEVR